MSYDAPQSRNEAILQNILGANNVLVDPQSRIEAILQAILYDETYDEEAMSRMEELLLAIKNNGTWNHEPISRNEEILYAKLNGETYDKEPQSRIEALLIDWCNQSPITVVTDTAPYLFRQSGGDNNAYVGTEETDKLVGASAVVNQLAGQHGRDVSLTNFSITYDSSTDSFTAVGTPETTGFLWLDNTAGIANHVYYGHSSNPNVASGLGSGYSSGQDSVRKLNADGTLYIGLIREIKAYNDTFKLNIIDLTAMFGTAIADYVYSLEQATAGSGIAYLRKYGFFTKDYYPYKANTLQSVNTSKHVMRDENNVIIGEYALPNIDLRGLYKLDANNNLYADGDTLEGDGTLTRDWLYIDLGTYNWTYVSASNAFFTAISEIKRPTVWYERYEDMICNKYPCATAPALANIADKTMIKFEDGRLYIKDTSYTDEQTFKASLNGVYLAAKRETPTTETVTGFTNPQIVSKDGTEEYVDSRDMPLPVGHETDYPS